ncbi:two-partner secretion domain-containing protein, partial [Microvirgula aerodenitrificans]|uniref:two-partner secretion domain-containing protein n=1 Tax=Microvirgula aerodenitrificans TaxID=57480 RepID=UPI00248DBBE5
MPLVRRCVPSLLLPLLFLLAAGAGADGIVSDPGAASTQQPVVQRTANGLPQVDIQTPNAAGVSHNHYRQFDVGPRGAILNNARHDVQTELGGWVRGNPALANGSARLIINEVNSSQPSLLRGLLEVAGPRADVIVANPSGITCAGCGFINADRSTLSTGRPQPGPQGNLDSFRVSNGTVRIEGAGLYAGLSSHTAIFARAVEINAGLWARHLRVVTGANRISADGDTVTAEAADAATRPQFALDSALLGGMYAGKIFLTGTEHGVGVNLGGKVTAGDGGLVLHADGRLEVSGTVHSEGSARLTARALHQRGTLSASESLTLGAASVDLDDSTLKAATITLDSDGPLSVRRATLTAGGLLAFTTPGQMVSDGAVVKAGQMTLRAGSLSNVGGSLQLQGDGEQQLLLDGMLNNRGGQIVQAGSGLLRLVSASASNAGGRIAGNGDLHWQAGGLLDLEDGRLSAGRIDIDSGSLRSRGQLHAGESLTLGAASVDLDDSTLKAATITLDSDGPLSVRRATLTAGGLLAFTTPGQMVSDGAVVKAGQMTLRAGSLSAPDSKWSSRGALTLNVDGDVTHRGQWQADGEAALHVGGHLYNHGKLLAVGALTLRAAALDNAATGEIRAGETRLHIAGRLHNLGLIDGDRLAIASASVLNEEGGTLAASEQLDVGTASLLNRERGLLFSAGGLAIGGTLDAQGRASGRAQTLVNRSSTIEALGDLQIAAAQIRNDNDHFASEVVPVSEEAITEFQPYGSPDRYRRERPGIENFKDEVMRLRTPEGKTDRYTQYSYTRRTYASRVTTSAPGRILAGGRIWLEADRLINDKSHILAGGLLDGPIGKLDNLDATGTRIVRDDGVADSYWRIKRTPSLLEKHKKDWQGYASRPYTPQTEQTIGLGVVDYRGHSQPVGSGTQRKPRPGKKAWTEVERPDSVIRTGGLELEQDDSRLFRPAQEPDRYVVETDPRYADRRRWLSSDAQLAQLQVDPRHVQRRLGDGFHEQRLVREQVMALTGRRFLGQHRNDEAQYRALLDSGVTQARAWQLVPGVALSAAQMAQLTSDMVWLVEHDIRQADGSTTRALVPQLYVQVRPGDLDGSGALLSADRIGLKIDGTLYSSGKLAGRELALRAGQIRLAGGRISGDELDLRATGDIGLYGTAVDGASRLDMQAGRDLTVSTTTRHTAHAQGSSTHVDQVARLTLRGDDGRLTLRAGRDLQVMGAELDSRGQTGVHAGRDLSLGSVATGSTHLTQWSDSNWRHDARRDDVGSRLHSRSDQVLSAGRDLHTRVVQARSEHGDLAAVAGRDLRLIGGEAWQHVDQLLQVQHRGQLSSTLETTRDTLDQQQIRASTLSGERLQLQAGRDLELSASQVASTQDTRLQAGRDLALSAGYSRHTLDHYRQQLTSGVFRGGSIGFTAGEQEQRHRQREEGERAVASLVGATDGGVALSAGRDYRQTGSQVLAPRGDIELDAQRITLGEARERSEQRNDTTFRQSGLSLRVSSPVITAYETARQLQQASADSDDPRLKLLAGAGGALAGKNLYDALKANPKGGGITVSLTVGNSRNEQRQQRHGEQARGAQLVAGGDASLRAHGAGEDSGIRLRGSEIRAGGDLSLSADGALTVEAARHWQQQRRRQHGSQGGFGLAASYGGGQGKGAAVGFHLRGGLSQGRSEGDDVEQLPGRLAAGGTLTLNAGGDITLRGAEGRGRRIELRTGGGLSLESLQDRHDFSQRDMSLNASGTYGYGYSVSADASLQQIDSDYLSVREQTALRAGDGGFNLDVAGTTTLKGAVIDSTAAATQNRLRTGSLNHSALINRAAYRASSFSAGGGYSGGGGGTGTPQQDTPQGDAPASDKQTGDPQTRSPLQGGGVSIAPPGAMAASDSASSVTRSAMAPGTLEVADSSPAQTAALASLSRDTRATGNAL